MSLVGPGAIDNVLETPGGTLDGVSELEWVDVHNPLTDDFAIRVGQSKPVNVPFPIRQDGTTSTISQTERDVTQVYGLNLKNPDFQAKTNFSTTTVIKSGETIRFLGNEAQVAVRQLTNELMQREGDSKLLADPELRRHAESKIIRGRGTLSEMMGQSIVSPQQQVRDAINRSNEETNVETEFPGLTAPNGGTENNTSGNETSEPEAVNSNRTGTLNGSKTTKR